MSNVIALPVPRHPALQPVILAEREELEGPATLRLLAVDTGSVEPAKPCPLTEPHAFGQPSCTSSGSCCSYFGGVQVHDGVAFVRCHGGDAEERLAADAALAEAMTAGTMS